MINTKLLRNIIFWIHLLVGWVCGSVIMIMSVTGLLLTYERQIIAWADHRNYPVTLSSGGVTRLPVETLLTKFREAKPHLIPVTFNLSADPHAPAVIGITKNESIFIDPYTGEILGEASQKVRNFFRVITAWHRWLGMPEEYRTTGRTITGICNLGFLFLLVSGFYLWWPRKWTWQKIRSNLWGGKSGLTGKMREFGWHNVIGFCFLVPLFIIVVSGVVISYQWADTLVYRIVGENPPAFRGNRGRPPGTDGLPHVKDIRTVSRAGDAIPKISLPLEGLDRLWIRAEQQVLGYRNLSMRLPASDNATVIFIIDRGDGGQPQKRSSLTLERKTAEVVSWEQFSSYPRGQQLRFLLRFAHTGEVAGIAGQTIAGIVSAGGAVLVWTGLAITWRRFRARGRSGETLRHE
ncbi:MAG TPA: PepSY-associated TM helix domain-containing protein [bacterium]|nr:PepSY-associated TM helix domain-containing protein [bacterium]